jgi:Protein of unknown function (DUF3293)
MPLSPELLTAYKNADYVVFGHQRGAPELVLRIGRVNADLEELLAHHEAGTAAFVTACNPRGEKKSYEENEIAAAALRASPALIGYAWFKGEGRDPEASWPSEPSLLIVGIARKEAEQLGEALSQNAIVFIEKGGKPELVLLE